MLKNESGDMDLAKDPEIDMNAETMDPKTGFFSRILRYKDVEIWACMEIWILQKNLRFIWMMIHGFGDVDFAEDPETKRCWDIYPRIWILQKTLRNKNAVKWIGILQRILRHTDAETWIRRRGSCRNFWGKMNAEAWIRKHIYVKGSWGTCGGLYSDPEMWILQRIFKFKDAGDMNPKS